MYDLQRAAPIGKKLKYIKFLWNCVINRFPSPQITNKKIGSSENYSIDIFNYVTNFDFVTHFFTWKLYFLQRFPNKSYQITKNYFGTNWKCNELKKCFKFCCKKKKKNFTIFLQICNPNFICYNAEKHSKVNKSRSHSRSFLTTLRFFV